MAKTKRHYNYREIREMEISRNGRVNNGWAKRMKVSVVVANHGRDLTLLKQSLPKEVELVVIDRGFERSKQRNMGIQESTGDIILWLDSDQSVSPGLIIEIQKMVNLGIVAIYVPEVIVGRSFFGRLRAFERTFYTGTAIDVPRAILKAVMPLFDESLNGPEDADLGQRIEGKRGISKNVLYHHDDIPFLEYCKKKAYYSKSMKKYAEKWPNDPCLNLKYRCWTVFTENGKWKELLKHPILTLGIVFLLATRGIIYASNR